MRYLDLGTKGSRTHWAVMWNKGYNWCARCGVYKPLTLFRKNSIQTRCLVCIAEVKKRRREIYRARDRDRYRDRKQYYADMLGGKCCRCFYSNVQCLDFHHVYADTKESEVSNLLKKGVVNITIQEIDKCILLCPNCHREYHRNYWEAEFIKEELGYSLYNLVEIED